MTNPTGKISEWGWSQFVNEFCTFIIGQREDKEVTGHQADPQMVHRHMNVPGVYAQLDWSHDSCQLFTAGTCSDGSTAHLFLFRAG